MMKTLAWIAACLLVASGLYAQVVSFMAENTFIPNGPASTWLMDEGTGQTAADSSSSIDCQLGVSTGVDGDDPTWITAGLRFDGSIDHLRCGDNYNHASNEPWSITAVVNFDTVSVAQDIVGKAKAGTPYEGYLLAYGGGGFQVYIINNFVVSTNYLHERHTSALSTGTWYHLAATYDGSESADGLKLYVNGAEVATTVVNDNLSGTPIAPTTRLYAMGRRNGDWSEKFDGDMGIVRHWTSALGSEDIAYWCNIDAGIMSGRSTTAPTAGCAAAP